LYAFFLGAKANFFLGGAAPPRPPEARFARRLRMAS
jgi:hypothetical protein